MMRPLAMLAVMAIGMPAVAQDAAPPVSERPAPRPENVPAVPVVPLRYPEKTTNDKTDSLVEGDAVIPSQAGQRDLLRLDDADYASCLSALRERAVVFEEVKAIVPEDDVVCGILQPIAVSEIVSGVALVPPAVIRCPTALALTAWVEDFVVPAARRLGDRGALTVIENGSGYICRRRNNEVDGALSEHAFGNAFDVMGFRFENGPPVMIEPSESQSSLTDAFQNAVRATACLEFSTVLGPGSNASHDDHLHLDILARDSGFRLCELSGPVAE